MDKRLEESTHKNKVFRRSSDLKRTDSKRVPSTSVKRSINGCQVPIDGHFEIRENRLRRKGKVQFEGSVKVLSGNGYENPVSTTQNLGN